MADDSFTERTRNTPWMPAEPAPRVRTWQDPTGERGTAAADKSKGERR